LGHAAEITIQKVVGGVRRAEYGLEATLKIHPDVFLEFYRTYGFSVEITTAYELEQQERKQAAEVAEEVFDEFDPIRARGMGVSLA
jgi:hypothetical protein